jgi:hypothetical protein
MKRSSLLQHLRRTGVISSVRMEEGRDIKEGQNTFMSTVQDIENAIRQLSPEDLAAFRTWFAAFDAEQWDQQFEEDVAAGRLESLAQEAIQDLREGRCTDL